MKAGLLAVSAALLLQLTAAQPHRHRHQHEKKEAVVTEVVTVAKEIVLVDENGSIIGTSLSASPTPTSTTPPPPPPPSSTPTPTPTPAPAPVVAAEKAPVAPSALPSSSAAPKPAPSAAPAAPVGGGKCLNGGNFKGATYNPYTSSGACKTTQQINADIASFKSDNVNVVRTYGPACNGFGAVVAAAKANGMSVVGGLFETDWAGDLAQAKTQLNGDLSGLSAITVWNEPINKGQASVSQVVAAIQGVRSAVAGTGFTGDIYSVDSHNQVLSSAYAPIVEAGDCLAMNAHPWFDPNNGGPSNAANWVSGVIKQAGQYSQGKTILVTETGWSSSDGTAGQQTAITQLKSLNVMLFSKFSTAWQGGIDATFGWEGTGFLGVLSGL